MAKGSKIETLTLTSESLAQLKKFAPVRTFRRSFFLFFEKQIPNVGAALVNGEIEVFQNQDLLESLVPGCLFGVNELAHNKPSSVAVKILKGSQICLIDRSSIQEILQAQNQNLSSLFEEIISSSGDMKCNQMKRSSVNF